MIGSVIGALVVGLIGVFSIGKVEDKHVDKIRRIVEGAGRQCIFIHDNPLPLLWEE